MDHQGYALYFSREPIPTTANTAFSSIKAYKQVCIIPFKRKFLLEFASLKPTLLEVAESIDMLRILEHGMEVRLVPTQYDTYAVDTETDRQHVEKLLANDPVTSLYCNQN